MRYILILTILLSACVNRTQHFYEPAKISQANVSSAIDEAYRLNKASQPRKALSLINGALKRPMNKANKKQALTVKSLALIQLGRKREAQKTLKEIRAL